MAFVDDKDFACSSLHGVYICQAKLPTVIPTYSDLQKKVRDVSAMMAQVRADVPPQLTTLVVDGRIGPTSALGAQIVVAAFNRTVPVPDALAPLVSTTPIAGPELIKLVAAQAPEITAYIGDVVANHPEALQALVIERFKQMISPISLKTTAMIAGGVLLVIGGIYAVRKMERQRAGLEDRSHVLPDSDEDEEEDDDDAESEPAEQ